MEYDYVSLSRWRVLGGGVEKDRQVRPPHHPPILFLARTTPVLFSLRLSLCLRFHRPFSISYQMEHVVVPKHGEWPVDPQTDVKISKDRIWVDGCFDFAHHGLHTRSS